MKRWDEKGEVLQNYSGIATWVYRVIELKNDIIVALSDVISMWKISTGECTLIVNEDASSLLRITDNIFASGGFSNNMLKLWSDKGECIEVTQANYEVTSLLRMGDSIITANKQHLEVRRLK